MASVDPFARFPSAVYCQPQSSTQNIDTLKIDYPFVGVGHHSALNAPSSATFRKIVIRAFRTMKSTVRKSIIESVDHSMAGIDRFSEMKELEPEN